MQQTFRKHISSLEGVFAYLDASLTPFNVDPASAYAVNLAVEELFTNMVRHAPEGDNDVAIAIEQRDKILVITLTDYNVTQFDITSSPDVDTTLPLEQRKPGGLGIHLVKHMVDSVDYRYENHSSIITFTKSLEK